MLEICLTLFGILVCFGVPVWLFWPGRGIALDMWKDAIKATDDGDQMVFGVCSLGVTLCCLLLVGCGCKLFPLLFQ